MCYKTQKEKSMKSEYAHSKKKVRWKDTVSFHADQFPFVLLYSTSPAHIICALLVFLGTLTTHTHRNWNTTQSHTWQVCAVSNLDLADLSAPTLIYWNVCACVCVCVISGNINCCSSETVCACMCVGVSELVPIKEETVRSCWVTMATGWAAMTGFC